MSGAQNLKRPIHLNIRLTEDEKNLVTEKMAAAGIRNREAYLRKMVLDGYILKLDLADVKKMVALLSNATNNLNQIARHANQTRNIYESDIRDLQAHYELLWAQAETILRELVKIQR